MKKSAENKEILQEAVKDAINASLRSFCRTGLPDGDCIDLAIDSLDIEEKIIQADAGDQFAKMTMRHMAACYLSSDSFGPIPAALRQFAARELEKLSRGTPGPNRPNGGRPPRTYRKKLVIAHWIHKTMKLGTSQNKACAALVECISKESDSTPEAISPEALRKIYREMLPDIEALYKEVLKIKATMIPIRCID